jgi:hypothetical protein
VKPVASPSAIPKSPEVVKVAIWSTPLGEEGFATKVIVFVPGLAVKLIPLVGALATTIPGPPLPPA